MNEPQDPELGAIENELVEAQTAGLLSEDQIANELGKLTTPELPTEVAERISHALAAEPPFGTAPADQAADTTANGPVAGDQPAAEPGVAVPATLDEKRAQRTRRQTVLGAVAGIAAVGVLAVVGLQVVSGPSSEFDTATESNGQVGDPQDAAPVGSSGPTPYAQTPVIVTGTTFTQASLAAQVEAQLPKWKRAYTQVQASPEAINDIHLNGTTDITQNKPRPVAAVTKMRQKLSDCLASLHREHVSPLVVDMAELRNAANASPEEVAVVALPQQPKQPPEADGYEVYFMSTNCTREATKVLAQLTVPNTRH